MATNSSVIITELYPVVAKALSTNSKKFLGNIAQFINDHHEQMYDIAPYNNIYFNGEDLAKLYRSIGFNEADILPICKNIYYWDKPHNPGCAKEPYVLVLLCAIRYYLLNNESKNAELTSIYLAFSGKIYASLYGLEWKYSPSNSRQVMDYVINNMLSDKFDLKKEGTIFGTIKKLCIKWLETYKSKLMSKDSDDKDCSDLLQQLRDRVKSFLKNIAKLFYQAYEDKLYLNYETDSVDEDNFHLTDNDANLAARLTAAAMNILTSEKVDFGICKKCVNDNVKSYMEIADIVESILAQPINIPLAKQVVNTIICDFLENNKNVRVGSTKFISYSLKPKPNTKSKMIIEMKAIITRWLEDNSAEYLRRGRTREATRNSYYKSVLTYFVLIICRVCES